MVFMKPENWEGCKLSKCPEDKEFGECALSIII